jgi:hypothetical protein
MVPGMPEAAWMPRRYGSPLTRPSGTSGIRRSLAGGRTECGGEGALKWEWWGPGERDWLRCGRQPRLGSAVECRERG